MWQQVCVYIIVAAAALYLGLYLAGSIRSIIRNKSGCGEGCGKCAYAKSPASGRSTPARTGPTVIPLTDIKSLPHRKS